MEKRIVYVDDEASNLRALERLLRHEDYKLFTYDSPLDALRNLNQIRPEVVISDQRMPEMTGIDFLEKVHDQQPDSVTIILTGHADLETTIDALNRGYVFRFIQKPWNDDQLKAEVKSALEYHASSARLRSLVDKLVVEIRDNEKTHKNMCRFTESVSNELSRSLLVVGGYVQLLQSFLKDDSIYKSYVSNIKMQVEMLEKLSDKISSVSQKLKPLIQTKE
jgi:two-component system, sensor histidine kinase and response regulator